MAGSIHWMEERPMGRIRRGSVAARQLWQNGIDPMKFTSDKDHFRYCPVIWSNFAAASGLGSGGHRGEGLR